jgi:hypothetical protein
MLVVPKMSVSVLDRESGMVSLRESQSEAVYASKHGDCFVVTLLAMITRAATMAGDNK